MQILTKIQQSSTLPPKTKTIVKKKERLGRWSKAQTEFFEKCLERYGKNWKKIHQLMPSRTLSQIRSHAQKVFQKIGAKKVQEYERRAKLLEAYEILEKEKQLVQNNPKDQLPQEPLPSPETTPIKEEMMEESNQTLKNEPEQEQVFQYQQATEFKSSEIIKEQNQNQATNILSRAPKDPHDTYPFLENPQPSYLCELLKQYWSTYQEHQSIIPMVDDPGFRAYALESIE